MMMMIMINKSLRKIVLFGAFALFPLGVHAATITFGPGAYGTPVAATAEGIYTYSTFSGALFRDSQGNGDVFNMEGLSGTGGVLSLVRNDVAGGLFTFDQADVMWQFNIAQNITFEGFLLGASVGSDAFLTTADTMYTTQVSSNLSGVAIDELRVTLNAGPGDASVVDNIVVSEISRAVPDGGASALMLLLSLTGLVGARMRSRRR